MQVNIKIDDELYRKLRESAKKHSRTITAQLGIILSNALITPNDLTNSIETTTITNTKSDTKRISSLPQLPDEDNEKDGGVSKW